MDQLSGIDASFLHLETPETPMHVGSLLLLDLPEGYQGDFYEDVKEVLGKRLHLSPILTRKLAQMPFELAEPVWIDDDDIDLDYHVRSTTLRRPGTMAQLEQLVARLHASLLDRSRPLWEAYVIDGLENGQVAFYFKAHHSGVDGKSGAELAHERSVPAWRHRVTAGSRHQCSRAIPQAGGAVADGSQGVQHGGQRRRQPAHVQRRTHTEPRPRAEDDLQRLDHQSAFIQHDVAAFG